MTYVKKFTNHRMISSVGLDVNRDPGAAVKTRVLNKAKIRQATRRDVRHDQRPGEIQRRRRTSYSTMFLQFQKGQAQIVCRRPKRPRPLNPTGRTK